MAESPYSLSSRDVTHSPTHHTHDGSTPPQRTSPLRTSPPHRSSPQRISTLPPSQSLNSIAESDDSVEDVTWIALQSAVCSLDVIRAEEIVKNDTTNICAKCYGYKKRSLLHELVLSDQCKNLTDTVKFREVISLLIEGGLDVNITDNQQQTALHLSAAIPGSLYIIPILLDRGVGINVRDSLHQTALHKAVQRGGASEVVCLLEHAADVQAADSLGHTPLHLAAKRKHSYNILEALIDWKADLNCQSRDISVPRGGPALHTAIRYGDYRNVELLLQHKANIHTTDSAGQLPVHIAAAYDCTGKILPLLHKHGANLNSQDLVLSETPLHRAVKHQMVDNFKYLCAQKANPNIQDVIGETVLHKAVHITKAVEWMTLVNTLGGNVMTKNCDGHTPMDKALRAKNALATSVMSECSANMTKRHSSYF